jgi:serine/threonine protein kinase
MYRSPEIFFGNENYGFPCDVWSVGAIIWEMIVGFPIYESKTTIGTLI